MKLRYCVFLFLVACYAAVPAAVPIATHCEDEEQIIFNCRIKNSKKVVSVCRFRSGQDDQYLQYVFGELGKTELVFPKHGHIKKGQFLFERKYSNFSGWLQYELTFSIGGNKYYVSWQELSKTDGIPKENVEISSWVNVSTSGGKSISLNCDENAVNNLDSAYGYNVKDVDQQ